LILSSPGDGGLAYQVASSLGPGPILLGNRKFPLAPDALFQVSIGGTATAVFARYTGALDIKGAAQAAIRIPAIPALSGLRIYSAFATFKTTAPLGVQSLSNHFALTIR
jgi:hypothetical protein